MTDPQAAPEPLRFEDYEKLCHWIARRLYAGQQSDDGRLAYDDVFQEVAIQWCKCRDAFDPSKGVKFSTFFVRSTLPQWRNVRRRLMGSNVGVTDSLHQLLGSGDGEGEVEMIALIEDQGATNPEAAAIRSEAVRMEFETNPLLERLSQLVVSPPPELQAQLEALQAQRAWGQELGVSMPEPATSFTPSMLGQLFNFDWRRRKLTRPLRGLVGELP